VFTFGQTPHWYWHGGGFISIGDLRGDSQMSIDTWLLIAADVLLSVWVIGRIIMLPAMLRNPGNGKMLTTYMQYLAEQRGKPRRR
jgi:hypothetical protein